MNVMKQSSSNNNNPRPTTRKPQVEPKKYQTKRQEKSHNHNNKDLTAYNNGGELNSTKFNKRTGLRKVTTAEISSNDHSSHGNGKADSYGPSSFRSQRKHESSDKNRHFGILNNNMVLLKPSIAKHGQKLT